MTAIQVVAAEVGTRPVMDLITELENSGIRFVFSTSLVRSDLEVTWPADTPVTTHSLSDALSVHGLMIDKGEDGTIFIVPIDDRGERAKTRVQVLDEESLAPLEGVSVIAGGAKTHTDREGSVFVIASGGLVFQKEGYKKLTVTEEDLVTSPIVRLTREVTLEEIVVVSSRYALGRKENSGPSLHSMTNAELNAMPELAGDALRAANRLPGTASVGVSARPHVRGGLQDELLVVLDGVELLEPFHLNDFQSVFSALNPELVEVVDVYTGGFPATYGTRMSGVMDVSLSKDSDDLAADVMISVLSASASASIPARSGKDTWTFSTRRGNLDLLIDAVNPDLGKPRYNDWFIGFQSELAETRQLNIGLFAFDDDILLEDNEDGDGESARSLRRNLYAWARLENQIRPGWDMTTILSYGSLDTNRTGSILEEDLEAGLSTLKDNRKFKLYSISHRSVHAITNEAEVVWGGKLGFQEGIYDVETVVSLGQLGGVIGLPPVRESSVDISPEGIDASLFVSARWLMAPRLAVEAGLRWDYQNFASNPEAKAANQISPRMSALYTISDRTDLRLSVGRYHQPELIHELQAADGVDEFQRAQYSDQLIAGLGHRFNNTDLSFRIEAFYKAFRQPKARYENLFDPWVLLPELGYDRVLVAPTEARARGLEATLFYEPSPNFRAWLGYTRASTGDKLEGDWRRRGWDQSHTISAGLSWNTNGWSVNAASLWHSGWRTTPLPEPQQSLERNSLTLPAYLSVDVRAAYTWFWPRQSLTLFAEVTNLTNSKNVGAYEYEFDLDEGGNVVAEQGKVGLIPIVPSLGIRWTYQ